MEISKLTWKEKAHLARALQLYKDVSFDKACQEKEESHLQRMFMDRAETGSKLYKDVLETKTLSNDKLGL